ncbi:MAG: LamG-like jellyroll fold domain-containing protein, partial [Pirellulales bacterium]
GVMETSFNGFAPVGTTDLRGGWHHVALTWDSADNSAKQYIDGVLDASGSMTNGWNLNLGEWEIGSQGRSGANVWDGLLDDARIFDNYVLAPTEVTHLASARGIEGPATKRRVSLRANASYVTDTDDFSVCTPNTATSTNQTDEYSAAQGFGFIAGTYSPANFRDRSLTLPTQLAGMTFQSANNATFRMDLPDGAGEYKVWFAGIDAAAGQTTGWRFKDGTGGTEFATLDTTTTSTQYVDINNTRQLATGFDIAASNYIQRVFTNDHFTIVRDTSLAAGNGVISSVWVEKASGGPPPATTFYDPFQCLAFYGKPFGTRNN